MLRDPGGFGRPLADERGVALPMALIALVLLSSLAIAFLVLSTNEPIIANNLLRAKQSRALAESGLEQALWAVINTASTGGLSVTPAVNTLAAAPYDGVAFSRVSAVGGFTVGITATDVTGSTLNGFTVLSTGRTTTTATSTTATAVSTVRSKYVRFPDIGLNAPCALCVSGNIGLTGSTNMAGGGGSTSCGNKYGVWTTGTLSQGGNAQINGHKPATQGTDYVQNQSQSTFDSFSLTASSIEALRALAQSSGRLYKPSTNGGTVSFSNMPNSGLIFVDTFNGCDAIDSAPGSSPTTSCQGTTADIGPGSFASPGNFTGWLVVMGNINTHGNYASGGLIDGLIYADGDVNLSGSGGSGMAGVVMVRRRVGTTDDTGAGNANVTFDCNAVESTSPITPGWSFVKGSYCDNPSGCP